MAIIDFVRANLLHGRDLLGPLVGEQIMLIHADALSLPFGDADGTRGFDAVWTVQVFQHISGFAEACSEAARVLKPGGRFINYSVQATPVIHAIHWLVGRNYHLKGQVDGAFYFARASDEQRDLVARIVGGGQLEAERYTECLFHPDVRLTRSGRPSSLLGRIDSRLGGLPGSRWLARQRSFEAVKPAGPP